MAVAIPAQIGGQPVFIIKENVVRRTGEEVLTNNAMVADVIGELMKTSLGPAGMKKLLIGTVGDLTITKSGVTILSEANIEHPVGKLFVELAKSADKNVGDGTTSGVIFAAELIKSGLELVKQGVHPSVVAVGFGKASNIALNDARTLATRIRLQDDALLRNVVKSVIMTSTGDDTAIDLLADIAIKVARSIAEKRETKYFFDTDRISIIKKVGGTLSDSKLIEGVLVEKEVQHPNMPKSIRDARVALVDFSLEIKKTEISAEIELNSPEALRRVKGDEREIVLSKIAGIIESQVKVLFCQKGVADFVAQKLAREGVMTVSRVKRSDIERLASSTGALIISDPDDIQPSRLGNARRVEEVQYGKDKVVIVEGERPLAFSVLLRGSDDDTLDSYERAVKRGVSTVANLYEDPRVLPGGGACMMEVAKAVERARLKERGEIQLAFEAYAKALEGLVTIIVNNSGLNKLREIAKLRTRHHGKTGFAFGVDGRSKAIVDVRKVGLYDPLRVFDYWIKTATDLASTVLRVDDIMMATKPSEKKTE